MYPNWKTLLSCVVGFIVIANTQSVWADFPPHLWSQRFGDSSSQQAWCVAVDDSGNVVTGGLFWGTVDFGGGALPSVGEGDIYLAKFDSDGSHIWSQAFGAPLLQRVFSIAVDKTGNVVITGQFFGTVDFGGEMLESAGNCDIFVAKFAPNGNHLWSQRFGGTHTDVGRSVAIDDWGDIIVTGSFYYTIDFGGGPLTSAGHADIFAAKFAPTGNHIWSQRFGAPDNQDYPYVTVDDSDNLVITGGFAGTVDFGGGPLESAGSSDIFLAKYSPNGNHIWSQRFGDASEQYPQFIAVDHMGNVVITGYFYGAVDFGGGVLESAGGTDIFIAEFESDGYHIWSQRFGDVDSQLSNGIAADRFGNRVVTGYFNGTVDFGGGVLESAGSLDIFMAKFDSSGDHLWSQRFGSWQDDSPGYGVAVDGSGDFVSTGRFRNTVDFGGGPLTSAGASDIYLAKYGPTAVGIRDQAPVLLLEIRTFPNPFNPVTTISFTLPRRMHASLGIYDVQGRLLRTLIEETLPPGPHEIQWDGREATGNIVGSGVYFCRLEVEGRVLTKKAVLLR